MTQRERVMAIAVGALALLMGGYYVISTGLAHYDARVSAVQEKERELEDAKFELLRLEQIEKKLNAMKHRSLPGDLNAAGLRYKDWLRTSLRECMVEPTKVEVGSKYTESGKEFGKFQVEVVAHARLDDLTAWLHEFQAINCLHRIKSLKLIPIENTRLLSVMMSIEAFTFTDVSEDESLALNWRLNKGQSEADLMTLLALEHERLQGSIAGRNMFGPPNFEPLIEPIDKVKAVINERVEVVVKAKDKIDGEDKFDDNPYLIYRVVDADIDDFTFDEVKGVFRWTPKKKGEYKATIEVADDGVPRKTSRHTFTIAVNDPPARPTTPPVTQAPPKPAFDAAKWAFVTAIVQEAGAGEVWINERSSGKSQKLKLGDEVQYGSVTGKISRIDATGVEVETRDAKFFTKVGQSLGSAAEQARGS
jgi:hypothetical protein